MPFTFDDVVRIYEKKRDLYGNETYRHVSEILTEAKELHKKAFSKTGLKDHEQSWRAFKGKNLEKLLIYILSKEVKSLGLDIIGGNVLERTSSSNLSRILDRVKRNLLIDYGPLGMHLPDVDLVIFDPTDSSVLAVVSIKVTLRERIAQTGYWKMKMAAAPVTRDIKVYFITPDEDGTLTVKHPVKKGRAIVETDTDGGYVMSEISVEESSRVKMFDKFISDIRAINLVKKKQNYI